ncbi:MAG: electron transport complex subunit RsxA [Firmicutes bacterium]|nr:electron transport complex subunit RsxA [Bacillota bacterium]
MRELIVILLGGILVNNVMLTRILGVCPFIGVSKQVETATGMGMAVIFVMTVASAVTWLIQNLILNPFNMGYLQTVSFILVIAALVQLIEMVVLKVSPTLYRALGIYLPLITTNCAVLGVAILNIRESYNLLEAAVSGLAGGAGFALAIILFAAMRERQELAPISRAMVGFPIALVTTGLMAMAFLGFSGFNISKLMGL